MHVSLEFGQASEGGYLALALSLASLGWGGLSVCEGGGQPSRIWGATPLCHVRNQNLKDLVAEQRERTAGSRQPVPELGEQ